MSEPWNRCDQCGHFIAMVDFENGSATRVMVTPDSAHSCEDWETTCKLCNWKRFQHGTRGRNEPRKD